MAKTPKFSEDQLLEAVVRFSEIERGKIKATELAVWCRNNMEGLEEVRDYHFTRPIKKTDPKSGKIIETPKLCTQKLNEINRSRSIAQGVNSNILLKASNIEAFFQQPDSSKRKIVVETRRLFDELTNRNAVFSRENNALRAENKSLKEDLAELKEKISLFEKAQNKLVKQVSYLMKAVDEEKRKEILAQMGIADESVDLDEYVKSLTLDLHKVMNINAALNQFLMEPKGVASTPDVTDTILSGINFDGQSES